MNNSIVRYKLCPKCNSLMLVKENRANGNKFWACPNWCKGGTMPYEEY